MPDPVEASGDSDCQTHIAFLEVEARMLLQVREVRGRTGDEVVQGHDFVAGLQQAVTEM